ncbi:MAG: protein-glutamate methylesterase/protein-glutamine glutaminase [Methylocystaceae bacterium]
MSNLIKVLVTDDSAFMRKVITDILNREPGIKVVDTARNGQEALEKIKQYEPDVVTLDVEMPIMDGITALQHIMKEHPRPVLMLSSLTQEGAELTFKALQLGAVDFIAKPSGNISLDIEKVALDIVQKVKIAAQVKTGKLGFTPSWQPTPIVKKVISGDRVLEKIVMIGTSTGGPKALHEVIPKLPGDLNAAVVLVQHMPPGFTRSLAERLDQLSALRVKEAEHGEEVVPGTVYIAPGDYHLLFRSHQEAGRKRLYVELSKNSQVNGHRPAVDPMLFSMGDTFWSNQMVAVIMTGMGSDGAQGLAFIKDKGGRTVAEDQSSCVVFGMPKAAIATGKVDRVIPLMEIAQEITRLL